MHDDKGWQGKRVISGAHAVTFAPQAAPFKNGLQVAVKGSQIWALYKANKYVKPSVPTKTSKNGGQGWKTRGFRQTRGLALEAVKH